MPPHRLPTVLAVAAATTCALGAGSASASAASTLYVSASATSDPTCAAASQANPFATLAGALGCASAGGVIHVGAGSFPGVVTVPTNVTIAGAGASTVITGSTDVTNLAPAIKIPDGRTVTIRNLTIDGVDQNAQGIVAGRGHLTVVNTTVQNTGAHGPYGAAIAVAPGSGTSTVTITGSTLADNGGDKGGGALYATAASDTLSPTSVTLTNSTLADNGTGSGTGGAIMLRQAGLVARDDTITGNSASQGGGISKDFSAGTVTLTNTILAGNSDGSPNECATAAGKMVDGGHDIIGVGCAGFADTVNDDRVGTPANPVDPGLGALAANGGPTHTMKPHLGSPAINAGDPSECRTTTLDQRSHARNADTRLTCDIGAVDSGGTPLQTLYVSATAGGDPACSAASQANPFKTIAAALACAQDGTTVRLGTGTFAGPIDIAHDVILNGTGGGSVIAGSTTPANTTPAVTVEPGAVVTLKQLKVDGMGGSGPGVVAHSGRLTLNTVTITRIAAFGTTAGGGLSLLPGPDTVSDALVYDSTIDHAEAQYSGGGISLSPDTSGTTDPPSDLAVVNSTITADRSDSGDGGGGIWLGNAALTVRDSTISGNSAGNYGGGIRGYGDAGITLTNTILAGNTAYAAPDCSSLNSNPLASGGHNVIGQIDPNSGPGCQAFADNGVNGDQVGTPAAPLDPKLATLANHGGSTRTLALLAGSPAHGAGSATDAIAWPVGDRDQRGSARNAGTRGASDVGAYDTGS